MKSRIAALALTTLVFGLMATGCPTIPELCDNGACSPVGSADVAQPDSEGGVGPDSDVVTDASPDREPDAPPGCGNANAPWENVDKCVVEGAGVFVSSLAATEGKGTKASPFKTLAKAMASIPTPRRLFVCAGTYTENVTITALVNVHGGFSCADWSYDATKNKVDIVASTEAAGLVVKGVVGEVTVSDVKVVAKSDVGKGKSSVAAFVATSSKVNFVRVTLEAKAGGDAEDGKDGNYTYPSASLLQGKNADGKGTPGPGDDTGGPGGDTGSCPGGGKSTGGVGGNIGFQGTDGTPSPLGGAKGAGIAACNIAPAGGAGADGRPAPDADPGAGAKVLGSLTAEGWSGKSGDNGKSGTPGGGGGGGYGTAGAGGGGGAGGCGGAGGTGGSAGGSSIALLVLDSEVALVASELVAVDGKPGGSGGTGQTGQSGAFRGAGSGAACNGGNGQKGGDGGQGGGGAGGVSAGIVWSGSKEPTRDVGTKLKPSTGAPAPGGGAGGAKGIDGQNKDVIKL